MKVTNRVLFTLSVLGLLGVSASFADDRTTAESPSGSISSSDAYDRFHTSLYSSEDIRLADSSCEFRAVLSGGSNQFHGLELAVIREAKVLLHMIEKGRAGDLLNGFKVEHTSTLERTVVTNNPYRYGSFEFGDVQQYKEVQYSKVPFRVITLSFNGKQIILRGGVSEQSEHASELEVVGSDGEGLKIAVNDRATALIRKTFDKFVAKSVAIEGGRPEFAGTQHKIPTPEALEALQEVVSYAESTLQVKPSTSISGRFQ